MSASPNVHQADVALASLPPSLKAPDARTSIASRGSATTQVLTQDEVDEKPWKYIGYKGYTDFIASENDFFMLRRFASISTRIALKLQDEVLELEEKLEELDKKYSRRGAVDVNNGSFRDDEDDRAQVLELLRQKLVVYSEFLF